VDTPVITDLAFGHPIMDGIDKFAITWGSSLRARYEDIVAYSDSDMASWEDTNCIYDSDLTHWNCIRNYHEPSGRYPVMAAVNSFNGGRVVGIGDKGWMVNDWIDKYDHYQLAWNIFSWLEATVPNPTLVHLEGTIKTADGSNICAMVLASGQFMFSCNPVGYFSLSNLPREADNTVNLQIYAAGYLPFIIKLNQSDTQMYITMTSASCPIP
jgi:hypothetical protein